MSHPSELQRHAMKPTRWVLFLRTCVLYQLLRFIWINLRMMRMIRMSHGQVSTALPSETRPTGI